jgi:hypothetical protein
MSAQDGRGVARPGLVFAVAVLLCLPMAPGVLEGAIPVVDALVRFLVALLLVWAAAAGLGGLLRRYEHQARLEAARRRVDEAGRRAGETTMSSPGPNVPAPGAGLLRAPTPSRPPGAAGTAGTAGSSGGRQSTGGA